MKRLVLSSQTPPSDVLRSAASRRETVYFVIYVSSHTSGHGAGGQRVFETWEIVGGQQGGVTPSELV